RPEPHPGRRAPGVVRPGRVHLRDRARRHPLGRPPPHPPRGVRERHPEAGRVPDPGRGGRPLRQLPPRRAGRVRGRPHVPRHPHPRGVHRRRHRPPVRPRGRRGGRARRGRRSPGRVHPPPVGGSAPTPITHLPPTRVRERVGGSG